MQNRENKPKITIIAYDRISRKKVVNAKVKITIYYKSKIHIEFNSQTDSFGELQYNIKDKLEPGEYSLVLNVSADNYSDDYSETKFTIK